MEYTDECLISNYPGLIPISCIEKIPDFSKKYICKIKIGETKGTGFFCKIPFPDKSNMIPVLITANHILNREILYKIDSNIQIDIMDDNDIKIINLNNRIKYTSDKNEHDITILEIKEEDNIKNYLELDERILNDILEKNNNKNKEFIDKTIFIIHYPNNKLSFSCGILKDINQEKKSDFIHLCATEKGSSGAPILNLNNKVIGIHKSGMNKNFNYNQGEFLNDSIKEFILLNYKKLNQEPTIFNESFSPSDNKFNEIKNFFERELLRQKKKKNNYIKKINENENSIKNISVELTPNNRVHKNVKLEDKIYLKTENKIPQTPIYRPKTKKFIDFTNELETNYKYDIKYPGNFQLKNKLKEMNYSMIINSEENLINEVILSNIKFNKFAKDKSDKTKKNDKKNKKHDESLYSVYEQPSSIIQKQISESNCKCQ